MPKGERVVLEAEYGDLIASADAWLRRAHEAEESRDTEAYAHCQIRYHTKMAQVYEIEARLAGE